LLAGALAGTPSAAALGVTEGGPMTVPWELYLANAMAGTPSAATLVMTENRPCE